MIGIWKIAATELSTANSLSKSTATLIISLFVSFDFFFGPNSFNKRAFSRYSASACSCSWHANRRGQHTTTTWPQFVTSTLWAHTGTLRKGTKKIKQIVCAQAPSGRYSRVQRALPPVLHLHQEFLAWTTWCEHREANGVIEIRDPYQTISN